MKLFKQILEARNAHKYSVGKLRAFGGNTYTPNELMSYLNDILTDKKYARRKAKLNTDLKKFEKMQNDLKALGEQIQKELSDVHKDLSKVK